jgi:hypothetical protein
MFCPELTWRTKSLGLFFILPCPFKSFYPYRLAIFGAWEQNRGGLLEAMEWSYSADWNEMMWGKREGYVQIGVWNGFKQYFSCIFHLRRGSSSTSHVLLSGDGLKLYFFLFSAWEWAQAVLLVSSGPNQVKNGLKEYFRLPFRKAMASSSTSLCIFCPRMGSSSTSPSLLPRNRFKQYIFSPSAEE